jgi:hypothetical protein
MYYFPITEHISYTTFIPNVSKYVVALIGNNRSNLK